MVKKSKENKLTTMSYDNNDSSQHVKETREVENVRLEENMTRGTCPKGET